MNTMTRRGFLATTGKALAGGGAALFLPAFFSRLLADSSRSAVAGTGMPAANEVAAGGFRKSTLKVARKHLLARKLHKECVDAMLSDGRIAKIEPEFGKVTPGMLRRASYEEYKKFFKYDELCRNGKEFCLKYKSELVASQEVTGVPFFQTAALLGVESRYGETPGTIVAANVFLTELEKALCAKAPEGKEGEEARMEIQKKKEGALSNLESLLKLCEKYGKDPLEVKGSYKGAITRAQFMPSNLWKYDEEGCVACKDFEDFFSIQSAILLASTYIGRNHAVQSYNPKDTPKYSRLILDLEKELRLLAESRPGTGQAPSADSLHAEGKGNAADSCHAAGQRLPQ